MNTSGVTFRIQRISLRLNGVVDIGLICLNNDEAVIEPTIEVLILSWRVFMHFVIVRGHTLGEYSRVNKFVCIENRLPHF